MNMFSLWGLLFDYIFNLKIENSSMLVESCKKPAKQTGNLTSRDTFLRTLFPRCFSGCDFQVVRSVHVTDDVNPRAALKLVLIPWNEDGVTVFIDR